VKVPVIAMLLSIIFNGLSLVVTSLKYASQLIHYIRLVHLTPCWLSSGTLFVALTLVVVVTLKCYLVS
jgi:hypothetical protein